MGLFILRLLFCHDLHQEYGMCIWRDRRWGDEIIWNGGNCIRRVAKHRTNTPKRKIRRMDCNAHHIHGIIIITNDHKKSVETTPQVVSTLKSNSLGSIIGQFKSTTTKRIHAIGYSDFAWQSRFYDHIIRNEKSLQKIREYIHNNPLKWDIDENNPDFLGKKKEKRRL